MPSAQSASYPVGQSNGGGAGEGASASINPDSSKFRRFFKRFGRHPSEDGTPIGELEGAVNGTPGVASNGEAVQTTGHPSEEGKKSVTSRSRKGSKTKGKRSDSLLSGRFFSSSSNNTTPIPPLPKPSSSAGQTPNGAPSEIARGFDGTNVKGLANTLTLPSSNASPPPQIRGLPHHDPIPTGDLMYAGASSMNNAGSGNAGLSIPTMFSSNGSSALSSHNGESRRNVSHDAGATKDTLLDSSSQTATNTTATRAVDVQDNDVDESNNVLSPQSSYGSSRSRTAPSFDSGSGMRHNRDSVDNRTMDTGKSRASTKPTTLMSMDTRDNVPGPSYAPLAQIAQHRQGDAPGSQNTRTSSTGRTDSHVGAAPSAIHFASAPPMGRTASGTIVQLPGQGEAPEDLPYTNVPTLSRPHPSNNPHPGGVPADNASMLTLASSTAAASIGGGAASSRGHSHAAPSLGGARSIGGSLMGDRRNSSDTYASVKALPPLSRRGSDSSSRTGMSIAASATGRNSAQAAIANAVAGAGYTAGPGAPGDRISIHRTPSQKTIATQLSIPLSTSNQAFAASQSEYPSGGGGGGGISDNLLSAPVAPAALGSYSSLPSNDAEPGQATDIGTAPSEQDVAHEAGDVMEVPSITTTQPLSTERTTDESTSTNEQQKAS